MNAMEDAEYIAGQMIKKYGLEKSLEASRLKASRPDFTDEAKAYWDRIASVLANT